MSNDGKLLGIACMPKDRQANEAFAYILKLPDAAK
jgi:hypothetical protein